MNRYELTFSVSSPAESPTFMEFSPNGRFLAVGDQDSSSLYILDKISGFYSRIFAATPATPTALVWETSKTFFVGLSDGRFIHYQVDLGNNKLVKGAVNGFFRGSFPVTAIALDAESKTLVLSVGPDVFASRRIHATSEFRVIANISSRFNFERDPGSPAPPFPKSIGFTDNDMLIVTFCRQNVASIILEFEGARLHSSFQTARIDYSGLSLLKAITSEGEDKINRLSRVWVHGSGYEVDDDTFPFLFINGGGAILSASARGAAILRDTATRRKLQLLEHTVIPGRRISTMAYHISTRMYTIATTDYGRNATIKVWTAKRPSPHPQGRLYGRLLPRKRWIVAVLWVTLIITMLNRTEGLPNIKDISQFFFQIMLIFVQLCIRIGYLILDAAEAAVLDEA